MKKSLLSCLLVLLPALAAPAPAQESFLPKGAVLAIKFKSFDQVGALRERMASLGMSQGMPAQLPIAQIHSMKGVDRKKPFYIFLSPPSMSPLFAMPLQDADAFVGGVKFPGFKPQVAAGYGLLAMEGSIPALGGKGLEGMPAGDLVVRAFVGQAMQSYGQMFAQYKMLVGMMTMSMGPEKSKAASQLYDNVVALLGQVDVLDFRLTDGSKELEIGLSAKPRAKTDLAKLQESLAPAAVPAGVDPGSMFWICNRLQVKGEMPALIKQVVELSQSLGATSPKNELTNALGTMTWGSFDFDPQTGLAGTAIYAVKDAKVLAKVMSTREGMVEFLSAFVPELPMPMGGGMGGGMPGMAPPGMGQVKEMMKQFLGRMEYKADALKVGDTSLHQMSMSLDHIMDLVDEGKNQSDEEKEKNKKQMRMIFGGEKMTIWLGRKDGNLVSTFGSQSRAEAVFGGKATTSLPAFAAGTLVSGKIRLGALIDAIQKLNLTPRPVTGKKGEKPSIPPTPIRFTVTHKDGAMKARARFSLDNLAKIMELMK